MISPLDMLAEAISATDLLTQLEYLDNSSEVHRAVQQALYVAYTLLKYEQNPPTFSYHVVTEQITPLADGSAIDGVSFNTYSIHT